MIRSHARQRTTPWNRRDRTLLYDPSEKGPVRVVELGRHARRRDVDETVRPLLVEPDHPVPQRLAIHPPDCYSACNFLMTNFKSAVAPHHFRTPPADDGVFVTTGAEVRAPARSA